MATIKRQKTTTNTQSSDSEAKQPGSKKTHSDHRANTTATDKRKKLFGLKERINQNNRETPNDYRERDKINKYIKYIQTN